MNRLQKKCVIATTGVHLLLLVILFVGPAFFWTREQPDNTPVLEMISPNVVDSVTTGVQGAHPPPAPVVPQPKPVVVPPTPPVAKPVVTPAPMPKQTLAERVEKIFKPEPVKPSPEPAEKQPHTPKVDLHLVTRPATKSSPKPAKTANTPDNSAAFKSALAALRKDLSSPTEIAPVGNSSVAAANYAQTVKAIYERAWTPPSGTASDDANVKVRVTIASDGTVVSAHIIDPSGDSSVDDSIQNTLDRVQFIEPFPAGSADKERTYIINFNLKAKRLNG